ncbi:hypothetical protein NQF87_07245 [Bombella sp. TMW 2.2559]|uniref:Uncharacterized protein n=1 Tax=Bombella dulcis TaxID=2967339 RepID=A0ABT3WCE8_9PROT|nr:hypothetical protein [Bombella dulcis]MCX5616765.1 hypothetical protein [Bombella dulcis]
MANNKGLATGFPQRGQATVTTLFFPEERALSFRSMITMTARERSIASVAAPLAYNIQNWAEEWFNLPQHNLLNVSPESDLDNAARFLSSF